MYAVNSFSNFVFCFFSEKYDKIKKEIKHGPLECGRKPMRYGDHTGPTKMAREERAGKREREREREYKSRALADVCDFSYQKPHSVAHHGKQCYPHSRCCAVPYLLLFFFQLKT
jgi:hypothetical protein